MGLTLRQQLTEALSHQQLDANFEYLHIEVWSAKSYEQGKIAYVPMDNGTEAVAYVCLKTHNQGLYTNGEFTATSGDGTRFWLPLCTGHEGTSIVDISLSGDTLVTVTDDGSTSIVDLSSLSLSGGTYSTLDNILTIYNSDGSYITIDMSGGSSIYIPTVPSGTTMTEAHGGLDAGTTAADLSGSSFSYIFDQILFPAVSPNYIAPSVNLTDNLSNLIEAASVRELDHTSAFSDGSITEPWNSNAVQDDRAGDINDVILTKTTAGTDMTAVGGNGTYYSGNTITQLTFTADSVNPHSFSTYSVDLGNQTFEVEVNYDAGPIPLDNFGDPIPGEQLGAGTVTSSITFEGTWPLYVKDSGSTFNKHTLYSFSSTYIPFNITYGEVEGNRHEFDVPDDLIAVVNSIGVQAYNVVSGNYDDLNLTLEFSTSSVTHTINNVDVGYTRYTKISPPGAAVNYRLKLT